MACPLLNFWRGHGRSESENKGEIDMKIKSMKFLVAALGISLFASACSGGAGSDFDGKLTPVTQESNDGGGNDLPSDPPPQVRAVEHPGNHLVPLTPGFQRPPSGNRVVHLPPPPHLTPGFQT